MVLLAIPLPLVLLRGYMMVMLSQSRRVIWVGYPSTTVPNFRRILTSRRSRTNGTPPDLVKLRLRLGAYRVKGRSLTPGVLRLGRSQVYTLRKSNTRKTSFHGYLTSRRSGLGEPRPVLCQVWLPEQPRPGRMQRRHIPPQIPTKPNRHFPETSLQRPQHCLG